MYAGIALFQVNLVSTEKDANKCRFNALFGWAGATEKVGKRLLCIYKYIWILLCLKFI